MLEVAGHRFASAQLVHEMLDACDPRGPPAITRDLPLLKQGVTYGLDFVGHEWFSIWPLGELLPYVQQLTKWPSNDVEPVSDPL